MMGFFSLPPRLDRFWSPLNLLSKPDFSI